MDNIIEAYIVKSSMVDFYLVDAHALLWSAEISEALLFSERTLRDYKARRGENLDIFLKVKITIV